MTWLPVVGACDLACTWCNVRGAGPGRDALDLAAVRARLRALRSSRARSVGFGFRHTEPMTSPELPAMIRAAREQGFSTIWLATSGLRLALPNAAQDLARAGLSHVLLSIPTTDERIGDVLLGRDGATRTKLEAMEACTAAGLHTSVVVMLARPALAGLPETVRTLRARKVRKPAVLRVNGCLMDPVPAMDVRHRDLVWPRYEEVAWAMRAARAVARGLSLRSSEMPLCERARVPGVEPKLRQTAGEQGDVEFVKLPFCRRCPAQLLCRGFAASYLETSPDLREARHPWSRARPPPSVDLASLRAALWGQRLPLEPVAQELAEVSTTGHYRCWASRIEEALGGLASEDALIGGYRVEKASVGRSRGTVQMRAPDDAFEVIVERVATAEKYFLKGRQTTVSKVGHAPLTPRQEACLRALLARLDGAGPGA